MKRWILAAGPSAALAIGLVLTASGSSSEIAWTAAITVLCATWWIFEPIPIPATSLVPLAVFPLIGVLDYNQVGAAYGDPLILLMMGGFMLSMAMERSGAHRRLALTMINACGGGGPARPPVLHPSPVGVSANLGAATPGPDRQDSGAPRTFGTLPRRGPATWRPDGSRHRHFETGSRAGQHPQRTTWRLRRV